jgi:hypothetical protein
MRGVRFLVDVVLECIATVAFAGVFGLASMLFGSVLFGSGIEGMGFGAFGFLWALTATLWKLLSGW